MQKSPRWISRLVSLTSSMTFALAGIAHLPEACALALGASGQQDGAGDYSALLSRTSVFGADTIAQANIPQAFGFNPLIPSDLTHWRTAPPKVQKAAPRAIALNPSERSPGWVLVSSAVQPYVISGDSSSLFLAAVGTRFAITGKQELTVRQGSVLVVAGRTPINVATSLGAVQVPPASCASIFQGRFGGVDVASLSGEPTRFTVSFRGKQAELQVAQNHVVAVSESQIATAGGSDFVPNLDRMSGPLPGLLNESKTLSSAVDRYLSQLHGVDEQGLSAARRASLDRVIQSLAGRAHEGNNDNTLGCRNSSAEAALLPVAQPLNSIQPSTPPPQRLASIRVEKNVIRHLGDAALFREVGGTLNLKQGEILIDSSSPMELSAGDCTVYLGRKTVALMSRDGGVTKVRNVCERSARSVEVVVGQRRLRLAAGQELDFAPADTNIAVVLKADKVERRRIETVDIDGADSCTLSEFSPVSLIVNNRLMNKLVNDNRRENKALAQRLIKMSACLIQVTGGRGPYEKVATLSK